MKIGNITIKTDHRLVMWLMVILITISYLYPLGIPITYSENTLKFYEEIVNIQAGDTIMIGLDFGIMAVSNIGYGMIATLKHFNDRGDVNLIIYGTEYDAIGIYFQLVEPLLKDLKYGEQYAFFGYVAGKETAIAKIADDMGTIFATDYFGTSIEDLLVMEGIRNANDIDKLFIYDTENRCISYIAHWFLRYGTKIMFVASGMKLTEAETSLKMGQITAILIDIRGAAEIEKLLGYPGRALVGTDMLSTTHGFVILIIIVGNVRGWIDLKEKGSNRGEIE